MESSFIENKKEIENLDEVIPKIVTRNFCKKLSNSSTEELIQWYSGYLTRKSKILLFFIFFYFFFLYF